MSCVMSAYIEDYVFGAIMFYVLLLFNIIFFKQSWWLERKVNTVKKIQLKIIKSFSIRYNYNKIYTKQHIVDINYIGHIG